VRFWRLPHITGCARLALWASLSIITLLLFFSFADLRYVYAPIESIRLLNNLPLFGALYYVWFALLLVLLFSPGKNNEWKNLALVCMFAMVFSGKWIVLSHGQIGACHILQYVGPISSSLAEGVMPRSLENFAYNTFPMLAIEGSSLALVTGLDTFDTITVFLVFQLLTIMVLFYVASRNYLHDGRLASIATVLLISGSIAIPTFVVQLHARPTGLLFLVAFLALVSKGHRRFLNGWEQALLFMILLAAAMITHAITSFLLFLVLLGIYLVERPSKNKMMAVSTVVLSFVVFLGWEIYAAFSTFGYLARLMPTVVGNLTESELPWSPMTSRMAVSTFGEAVPTWAVMTRWFWMFALIGLGGVLGIANLIRIRNLSPAEKIITGGLIGVGVFAAITIYATSSEELARALMYLPVFTIPILLMFLSRRKVAIAALIGLVFLLSFPTFLTQNSHPATTTLYAQEWSATDFMGSSYQEESSAGGADLVTYLPTGNYPLNPPLHKAKQVIFLSYPLPTTPSGLWATFSGFVAEFRNPHNSPAVLMFFSPRYATTFQSLAGIDPTTDERWDELRESINQESQVYDNGFVQIYQAQ
jgi:hypothetical protein